MNEQQQISATTKTQTAVREAPFTSREAHLVGLVALAAAIGLNWLFSLHALDKAATSLHWSALLVYGAVLADNRKSQSYSESSSSVAAPASYTGDSLR